jgi:hypothetical protein
MEQFNDAHAVVKSVNCFRYKVTIHGLVITLKNLYTQEDKGSRIFRK